MFQVMLYGRSSRRTNIWLVHKWVLTWCLRHYAGPTCTRATSVSDKHSFCQIRSNEIRTLVFHHFRLFSKARTSSEVFIGQGVKDGCSCEFPILSLK